MLSLLIFLFSGLSCGIFANLIKNDSERVKDIVHTNFENPNISSKIHYVSDFMVFLQVTSIVIIARKETISEILLIMGICQIFRLACFTTTILPPLKKYEEKFRFGGVNGSGTEYIFSGHASWAAVSFAYLYIVGSISFFNLFWYNVISQFLITYTRNHYTVDVILGWIITLLIFGNVRLCILYEPCFTNISKVL